MVRQKSQFDCCDTTNAGTEVTNVTKCFAKRESLYGPLLGVEHLDFDKIVERHERENRAGRLRNVEAG